jgi:hypothetical protein
MTVVLLSQDVGMEIKSVRGQVAIGIQFRPDQASLTTTC